VNATVVPIERVSADDATQLFVDANGAYARKQAAALADAFAELRVTWFEQPMSSDDVVGPRLFRDRAPSGLEIAAGEYGWTAFAARRVVDAQEVEGCLRPDPDRPRFGVEFKSQDVEEGSRRWPPGPYANAVQWAHPGRHVVAFVGDGGFAMLMAEFNTACRYGLPIKVIVNNNSVGSKER